MTTVIRKTFMTGLNLWCEKVNPHNSTADFFQAYVAPHRLWGAL
jgi:hypothetical protein